MNKALMSTSINLVCTEKCNLNCVYCYRKDRRRMPDKLNKQHITGELEKICNSDIFEVVITGGEPTLYPNFDELVRMFNGKRKVVLTNGIRQATSLDAIDEFVVSLDGKEEAMLLNRGVSTEQYKLIRNNIEFYLKADKPVTIHCVVTQNNINSILEWIYEEPYVHQVKFCIAPVSDVYNGMTIGLSQNQYGLLRETLKNLLEKFNFHIDMSTNIVSKRIFLDMVSTNNPVLISPDFNLSTGKYELYNDRYDSFEILLEGYYSKMRSVTEKIVEYLHTKANEYLFEPYSLAEKLLKEGNNNGNFIR